MPCPITSALGVGALFGGAHTLFIQDRGGRPIAWSALFALAAGWAAYLAWYRVPEARIALEVVSVAAVVAAVWRLRWLSRHRGLRSPLSAGALGIGRRVWGVIGSPAVLAAKVWLAAMLVMEWRGKAHFGALEYTLVSAVIVALVAHRLVAARRAPRFGSLESFAAGAPVARCPLGFGCSTAAVAGGETRVAAPATAARREAEAPVLEPAGWA